MSTWMNLVPMMKRRLLLLPPISDDQRHGATGLRNGYRRSIPLKFIMLLMPFKGWDDVQVRLPIIANAEIASVVVSMDLRVFEAAMKGRDDLREMFGTPYVACSQWQHRLS